MPLLQTRDILKRVLLQINRSCHISASVIRGSRATPLTATPYRCNLALREKAGQFCCRVIESLKSGEAIQEQ
jgi:hypothetical protein